MTDDGIKNNIINRAGAYRLTTLALLATFAIILGYVEVLIPLDLGIPGVKLGLCNIVILITLMLFSWREALLVSLVRILAVGFMFGNLFSISYGIAGSFLAILIMTILLHSGLFGCIGISASGGAAHGLGQLAVAKAALPSLPFAGYASMLILSGIAAGTVTGFIAYEVLIRVKRMS